MFRPQKNRLSGGALDLDAVRSDGRVGKAEVMEQLFQCGFRLGMHKSMSNSELRMPDEESFILLLGRQRGTDGSGWRLVSGAGGGRIVGPGHLHLGNG